MPKAVVFGNFYKSDFKFFLNKISWRFGYKINNDSSKATMEIAKGNQILNEKLRKNELATII
jgi:hypothetical protein